MSRFPLPDIKYNFNKTNTKKIEKNFRIFLRNFSNKINNYIGIYRNTTYLVETTDFSISCKHVNNNINSMNKYIILQIKKFRKQKSHIITKINRLLSLRNYILIYDLILKKILKHKYKIKKFFKNQYAIIGKIINLTNNHSDVFPSINNIF